jgi:hypothetical protein
MSYEVERIWKVTVVGCKILSWQLSGENGKVKNLSQHVRCSAQDSNAVLPKNRSKVLLPEPIRSVG